MTTNNHPSNGPVSLDRLHQISEILSKAAAQSDGGNLGYAMADAVKVIDGAIASFGAEPVGYFYADKPGDWYQISDGDRVPSHRRIPLYANPQSSAVVKLPNEFFSSEGIVVQIEKLMAVLAVHGIQYERRGNACRAAMLQLYGNSEQLDEVGSWNNHMNTPTDKPAINTDELLKHIEGMEVSVDVSTCDADAGHRYFGTVTEISELDTARNGYILLVQDAKPNFKPAGNSPATPDGWQLVPKEPTEAMNKAGWAAMNEHDAINPTYRAMLAAAPQQDVRLALEIGMSRYAGAMQKLVDSGD
ncbi:hypothetical protein V6W99_23195 [Citrobacter portucalensis]|uniref:hypothetical protein n=1 Tax=Citrobacter portucalensis TaxID=1639133 RepID=UPI002FE6490F